MKAKSKKRLKRDIFTIIATLFGMIFIAGCGDMSWYGTGIVESKTYHEAGYRPVSWSQKNEWQGECFELTIRDKKERHKGCVSERVWNDAMLDHSITLTKDYK